MIFCGMSMKEGSLCLLGMFLQQFAEDLLMFAEGVVRRWRVCCAASLAASRCAQVVVLVVVTAAEYVRS